MPESKLSVFLSCAEYIPREKFGNIPSGVRGIYVLLREVKAGSRKSHRYDVTYVGMSNSNVRKRVAGHSQSRRKGQEWTHFSVYRVFDNVKNEDILEIEGLIRAIYRKDSKANNLNLQKRHRRLSRIRKRDIGML